MDKNDYIKLRNENQMHQLVFLYYKEKGGTHDFQTCMKLGLLSMVNADAVVEELDKRFGVTLVMYNEKLIRVQ